MSKYASLFRQLLETADKAIAKHNGKELTESQVEEICRAGAKTIHKIVVEMSSDILDNLEEEDFATDGMVDDLGDAGLAGGIEDDMNEIGAEEALGDDPHAGALDLADDQADGMGDLPPAMESDEGEESEEKLDEFAGDDLGAPAVGSDDSLGLGDGEISDQEFEDLKAKLAAMSDETLGDGGDDELGDLLGDTDGVEDSDELGSDEEGSDDLGSDELGSDEEGSDDLGSDEFGGSEGSDEDLEDDGEGAKE
jgi:hypothetical protein